MNPTDKVAETVKANSERPGPDGKGFYDPPPEEPATTDFGRGYATCLIQFIFHEPWLERDVKRYAEMKVSNPSLFDEKSAVELWANGSTDHLYGLVRPPKGGYGKGDWALAKRVQSRGLNMGHGFTHSYSARDARGLLDDTRRLLKNIGVKDFAGAVAWDKAHGLKPDKGTWSCTSSKAFEEES